MVDTRTFAWGIEEKGEQAAGRERFRDSEGVGLRANSPLRRGPGQFDRTPDAFALSARKPFRRTYVRRTYKIPPRINEEDFPRKEDSGGNPMGIHGIFL